MRFYIKKCKFFVIVNKYIYQNTQNILTHAETNNILLDS